MTYSQLKRLQKEMSDFIYASESSDGFFSFIITLNYLTKYQSHSK